MSVLRFGLVAAVSMLLGACIDIGDTSDCQSFCHQAASCGVIPSPLGAELDGVSAEDNCIARCSLTEPDARSPFTRCDPGHAVPDAVSEWCGGACEQMAQCLLSALPDAGILGKATLEVRFTAGDPDPSPPSCALPLCSAETCSSCTQDCPCDAQFCKKEPAPASCPLGATMTVLVEQRGQMVQSTPLKCAPLASLVTFKDELAAGPVRPSAMIQTGTTCKLFPGDEVVLFANTTGGALVRIPKDLTAPGHDCASVP
jgi:hypothetical protein